jgi:uncharacterized protein YndB with AHSA1/START domain
MNEITVTNELEIRVERVFDASRAHVFSILTDPQLIPEWWGDGAFSATTVGPRKLTYRLGP